MAGTSVGLAMGWCETHQKLSFASRRAARQSSRLHRGGDRKSVYECDAIYSMWHVGGLPVEVRHGKLTRDEFFGRRVA